MGLTERHWFENEDVPENYEWALEDAAYNSRATEKGWISVKDRLPKKSGEYLVIKRGGHQDVLAYSARHEAFNAYDILDKPMHEIKVTHWMPLPEPPKEGE